MIRLLEAITTSEVTHGLLVIFVVSKLAMKKI